MEDGVEGVWAKGAGVGACSDACVDWIGLEK